MKSSFFQNIALYATISTITLLCYKGSEGDSKVIFLFIWGAWLFFVVFISYLQAINTKSTDELEDIKKMEEFKNDDKQILMDYFNENFISADRIITKNDIIWLIDKIFNLAYQKAIDRMKQL